MTNDKSVYNLPLVNYNIYWPIIGHLYCMTSYFIGHYMLISVQAQFIAQSIGQAFQVAYMEFLKANGIEDNSFVKEMDYQVR